MGLKYNDIMDMTLKEINTFGEGYIERERKEQNKLYFQIHQQALLNSVAILDHKSFPKEPKRVEDDNTRVGDYDRNSKNNMESLHSLAKMLVGHAKKK